MAKVNKKPVPETINGQQIKDWDDLEAPIGDATFASGVLVDLLASYMRSKYGGQGDTLLNSDQTDRLSFAVYDIQRRLHEIEAAYLALQIDGERP